SETKDTLAASRVSVESLQKEINKVKGESTTLKTELEQVKQELLQQNSILDSINFLGSSISKTGYHVLVWSIIGLLIGLNVFVYILFKRSHIITKNARRDLGDLQTEFEDHKKRAREKEVKNKRELQTAINKLNEKRP
ncbi:MAG: hypothetical protein AAF789_05800, partial [Bacteroidota bacterium]